VTSRCCSATQVQWSGALVSGGVGSHDVRADVVRLVNGARVPACIIVGFDIEDGERLKLKRRVFTSFKCGLWPLQ
jgi:hypothetical protein